ncbi:MAG TPA: hypothetical protein VGH99_20005 [Pseudonocardia sp.]
MDGRPDGRAAARPTGFTVDPGDRLGTGTVLALWWSAVLDGRSGLPQLADDSAPPPTPRVGELDHRRLELIERERARLVADTADLLVRREEIDARIRGTEGAKAAAREPEQIEQRRLRLGELERSRALLDERIVRDCVAAQSRARSYDRLLRRCCARYARTLLRHHPDGAALARIGWPTLGEAPAWVVGHHPTAALSGGDGAPARTDRDASARAGDRAPAAAVEGAL